MKTNLCKKVTMLSIIITMAFSVTAQIKIGKNPKTINKGSILEMETDSKGVLFPRVALTASNVWEPLQGTAVEGMTVYNTATVTATTSSTTSLSPGFYFWEGSTWHRLATDGELDGAAEWVYDEETKRINLKRSGQDTGFVSKVFYDTNTGGYYDYTDTIVDGHNNVINAFTRDPLDIKAYKNYYQANSKDIEGVINAAGTERNKFMYEAMLYGDEEEAGNKLLQLFGGSFRTITSRANAAPTNWMAGLSGRAYKNDEQNTSYLMGGNFSTQIQAGNIIGYTTASRHEIFLNTPGTVNKGYGLLNFVTMGLDAKKVNKLEGAYNRILIQGDVEIPEVRGVNVWAVFKSGNNAAIGSLVGYEYSEPSLLGGTIERHYGLKINNVTGGTESNHAIYTNAGDIRFGVLAGTGSLSTDVTDKIVVADTDGVLKTKDAATLVAAEWVYDEETKRINLKRSGTAPFTNKVYYDEKGNYKNLDRLKYDIWNYYTNSYNTREINSYLNDAKLRDSKNLLSLSIYDDYYHRTRKYKTLNSQTLLVNETEDDINLDGNVSNLIVEKGNTANYERLRGGLSRSIFQGEGEVDYITGFNGVASMLRGTMSSGGHIEGIRGTAGAFAPGYVNRLTSISAYTNIGKNVDNVKSAYTFVGTNYFRSGADAQVTSIIGVQTSNRLFDNVNATVENTYGFLYGGYNINSGSSVNMTNHYGLYMRDVDGADNNYAIYTQKGKVRLGDLPTSTTTTDKIVVADTDGVLKTKDAATLVAAEWKDGTVSSTNLIYAAQAKTAGNDVVITDDGKIGIGTASPTETLEVVGSVKATSFMTATMQTFPDYVFEKYYAGTSALKKDYNFKSLNEVESFVKTNGHLPGYLSAKEVAQKGSFDMTQTQLINVEKIEELYLHTIEQEKKIDTQQEQIAAQQKEIEELKTLVKQLLKK